MLILDINTFLLLFTHVLTPHVNTVNIRLIYVHIRYLLYNFNIFFVSRTVWREHQQFDNLRDETERMRVQLRRLRYHLRYLLDPLCEIVCSKAYARAATSTEVSFEIPFACTCSQEKKKSHAVPLYSKCSRALTFWNV